MKLTVKLRIPEAYTSQDGKQPFYEWLRKLKDLQGKARIIRRIDRAASGNFGVYRDLQSGVHELKEDFGPGYRIYFGIVDDEVILLLAGGDKKSQERDVTKAREYWTDYLWRNKQ